MRQTGGGFWNVMIFLFVLGITSFMVLLCGQILYPFFSIMPSGNLKDFFHIVWPWGVMLAILILSGVALLMSMQKKQYDNTGGGTIP